MNYEILVKSPLFRGLDINDVKKILSETPHRLRKYSTGQLISQSGDIVDNLQIVIEGSVKGEMVDFSGRVIKIEDIPASGALASAFIFGSKNRFPVNVIAISDTEILFICKSDFLKMMMSNDTILLNFLDLISNRSQFLSEKIKFLNFKTIKGKLAQYLLTLAGEKRSEIRLTATQNDLADFFGVARPSIARALGEMEEQGIIRANGKSIQILEIKRLSELTIE